VLEAQDKPKDADSEYRKAIELNPRFASAYIKLGYLYYDHDYDKEAVQVFQNAVLANDSDGEAHMGLGLALQKTKQYEEGVKEFKKALELNPELFLAVYNLGITYKMMDDKKNAKEWLQRFITSAGSKGGPDLMKAASDSLYQLDAP
jgi:superkiller protein 3